MSGVEIRVRSNSTQARRDLNNLEKSIGSIDRNVKGLTNAFKSLAVGIGAAFAATSVTRGINRTTDSLTSMENRVALVTGRTKELNTTLDKLYNISRRTGQPVDLAAETFNRFGLALQGAGKSSEDILKAVESVNKSIAISGGSVESARAALTQLGQGLASGTLRGEELNSVLEQAPRLAQAIADSMGKPRGALRKLAEQGELTTSVVFDALLSQSEKLNHEFSTLEITSAQAMTTLKDQVGRVTGEISKQLNITSSYTDKILRLSSYIEANKSQIVGSVSDTILNFKNSFNGIISVASGLGSVIGSIIQRAVDALPRFVSPVRTFFQQVSAALQALDLTVFAFANRTAIKLKAALSKVIGTGFQGAFSRIFNSKSLIELGENLKGLSYAIDTYGKRWYNIGNRVETTFRKVTFGFIKLGRYFGVFKQDLTTFKYVSFERFGKSLVVIERAFKRISSIVSTSKIYVAFRVAIIQLAQGFRILGNSIDNTFNNSFTKGFKSLSNLMSQVKSIATSALGDTVKIIEKSINFIERKFFWLYDEVIQNSWWTDLMEGVLDKAQEFLPKTLAVVKNFAGGVSNYFKDLYALWSFKDLDTDINFKLTVSSINLKALKARDYVVDIAGPLASSLSNGFSDAFNTLRKQFPAVAGFISVLAAGALSRAFAPSLYTNFLSKFNPLLYLTVFTAVVTAFDNAILKSGFFESVAYGLGNTVGAVINSIVSNIPQILQALTRVAVAFGEGLADAIGNSIIGLPAKILSFVPGGGLLTTLLYGGVAAAVFFKGVRTAFLGFATSALTVLGAKQKTGILYDLFVGSNPAVARKQIIGASKDQLDSLSQDLAQRSKRRGLTALASLSGYIIGAEMLLGDLIGTTGAAIVGIGASVMQQAVLGDPAKVNAIVSTFNSVLSGVISKVSSINVSKVSGILSNIFDLSSVKSSLAKMLAINLSSSNIFVKVWKSATDRSARFFGNFSKTAAIRIAKIGALAVLATAVTSTFAKASDGTDGSTSEDGIFNGVLTLGITALILFGDTIVSKTIPAIKGLFSILAKSTPFSAIKAGFQRLLTAFLGFGATAGAAFGAGFSAALSAFFAAIPILIITAIASAAILLTGGIAAYIFGEGDTIKDRIKDSLTRFGVFFRLIKKDALSTRETIRKSLSVSAKEAKGLKNKDLLKGSNELTFSLASASLVGRSNSELLTLEKLAREQANLTKDGNREVAVFGRLTEATRLRIEENTRETADLLAKGEGSTTEGVTTDVSTKLGDVLTQAIGGVGWAEVIREGVNEGGLDPLKLRIKEGITGASVTEDPTKGRELTLQERLFAQLSSGKYDFEEVASRQAFAADALMALGDDLPQYFKDILLTLSTTKGDLTGEMVDAVSLALAEGNDFSQIADNKGAIALWIRALMDPLAKELPAALQENFDTAIKRQGSLNKFSEMAAFREAFFTDLEILTQKSFKTNLERAPFDQGEVSGINELMRTRTNLITSNTPDFNIDEFTLLGADEQQKALAEMFGGLSDTILAKIYQLDSDIAAATESAMAVRRPVATDTVGVLSQASEQNASISFAEGMNLDSVKQGLTEIYNLEFEIAKIKPFANTPAELERLNALTTELSTAQKTLGDNAAFISTSFSNVTDKITVAKSAFDQFGSQFGQISQTNLFAVDPAEIDNIAQLKANYDTLALAIQQAKDAGAIIDPSEVALLNSYGVQITEITTRLSAASQPTQLLSDAFSRFANVEFDLNKVLQLDSATLKKITDAQTEIAVLTAVIAAAAAAGSLPSPEQAAALLAKEVALNTIVDSIRTNLIKPTDYTGAGGGDTETVFEKFVGSLSDSGFALDIEMAASLSRKAINSLKGPLSQIEKAQKAIVNSALGDSKARQASLVAIRAQKLEILDILTQGSVAQANEAYSAFGLDPEQVGKSAQAETIGRRILDLQLQLNDASNLDYETKSNIIRELEYQQELLANITSDSMAASDNIRSAFAESFKSLLKGESSMKGFFTSLLDSISENIIDTVVDSFTQAFFRASNLDTMFDTFFSKLMGSASSVGNNAGIEVKTGIEAGLEGMEDGGLLSGLSAGFTSILGSLGKGLSSIFEGLSGMFSGGGGFLSSILGAFSGAPLHTGGIVQMRSAGGLINPNIGQAGKDSVPVMLTPGEYVLPSQRTAELLKSNSGNNGSNQTVVNLSVTGDISRQTRKEIIKLMPSIAQGVNSQNKENNYRR